MRLRILTIFATSLALLLAAPSHAGTVGGTATMDLLWDASDNPSATGIGTDTIGAAAGDEIILGLYMTLDSGTSAAFISTSIEFDNDGGDELDLLSVTELNFAPTIGCTPFPSCFTQFGPDLTNLTVGIATTMESTQGAGGGLAYTFEMGTLGSGPTGPVTIKMGEVAFAVTNNVASDGVDVVSGAFNAGIDDNFDNSGAPIDVTFNDATVNTLPSPSTGLMALVSLGALGLVARRR